MYSTLTTSIQADNTTYVQYKTGKRAEAAIASFTSFITKVAQGIGGAIPGYVLAATGFVTGLGCPAGEYQYRNYPLRTDTSDYPDFRRGDSFWYTVYVG